MPIPILRDDLRAQNRADSSPDSKIRIPTDIRGGTKPGQSSAPAAYQEQHYSRRLKPSKEDEEVAIAAIGTSTFSSQLANRYPAAIYDTNLSASEAMTINIADLY